MRRLKLLLAVDALMVMLLAIQAGPAMAQSFSNEGNVSDQDSFIVTENDALFDDDFDRCRGFDDGFRCDGKFFADDDEFGFLPFFFDDDFFDNDDFDNDGRGVSQSSEQEADSGDVDQSFEVS
jgi:hypothetical protein